MAATSLNALHTFLTVARRRSFAAAARELGISPSALSQAVRPLEERRRVTVLARTTPTVDADAHIIAPTSCTPRVRVPAALAPVPQPWQRRDRYSVEKSSFASSTAMTDQVPPSASVNS